MMTLDETKVFLSASTRYELRDHAFGDREVSWIQNGVDIAWGYFSGSSAEVSVTISADITVKYVGQDALDLLACGTLQVSRNDETGPDEYAEGEVMEGLTLDAVRREICR